MRERLQRHQSQCLPPNGHRVAAVALILRVINDTDTELLFIRRAEHPADPWSGHIAFPGGRMDPGDDDSFSAVCRETAEEVAIDLRRYAAPMGKLDEIRASARGRLLPMVIVPYVFALTRPVSPQPNAEVERILWIRSSTLLDPKSTSTIAYDRAGERFLLPCFRIAEHVIWGLTYQMLMRFFEVMQWPIPARRGGLD